VIERIERHSFNSCSALNPPGLMQLGQLKPLAGQGDKWRGHQSATPMNGG
jgi:hypothetical protein